MRGLCSERRETRREMAGKCGGRTEERKKKKGSKRVGLTPEGAEGMWVLEWK